MDRIKQLVFLVALIGGFVQPAAAQQVLRVNPLGTGGAFVDIQPAIDAANEGDLVLVATGNYSAFVVDGKSIRIAADSDSQPIVVNFQVVSLAADQLVDVHGISCSGTDSRIRVFACLGPVLLQDCSTFRPVGFPAANPPAGLFVSSSKSVTVINANIDSSLILYSGPPFGAGLSVADSNLYVYGSIVRGARGADAEFSSAGGTGGPGATIQGSFVLFSECSIGGGPGGMGANSPFSGCSDGGVGGTGLEMTMGAQAPFARRVDTNFIPGAGGQAGSGICSDGPAGKAIDLQAGLVAISPFALKNQFLGVTPVVRPGESLDVQYRGNPFALTWVAFAPTQENIF